MSVQKSALSQSGIYIFAKCDKYTMFKYNFNIDQYASEVLFGFLIQNRTFKWFCKVVEKQCKKWLFVYVKILNFE